MTTKIEKNKLYMYIGIGLAVVALVALSIFAYMSFSNRYPEAYELKKSEIPDGYELAELDDEDKDELNLDENPGHIKDDKKDDFAESIETDPDYDYSKIEEVYVAGYEDEENEDNFVAIYSIKYEKDTDIKKEFEKTIFYYNTIPLAALEGDDIMVIITGSGEGVIDRVEKVGDKMKDRLDLEDLKPEGTLSDLMAIESGEDGDVAPSSDNGSSLYPSSYELKNGEVPSGYELAELDDEDKENMGIDENPGYLGGDEKDGFSESIYVDPEEDHAKIEDIYVAGYEDKDDEDNFVAIYSIKFEKDTDIKKEFEKTVFYYNTVPVVAFEGNDILVVVGSGEESESLVKEVANKLKNRLELNELEANGDFEELMDQYKEESDLNSSEAVE